MLNETNGFKLVVDNEEDLAGLSKGLKDAAAQVAKDNGEEGKWMFTLQKPSWLPFLQYAENRDLREKLYKAMYTRGDNDNEFDNKEYQQNCKPTHRKANMMGYETHADFEW